jgi:hypothetical protein
MKPYLNHKLPLPKVAVYNSSVSILKVEIMFIYLFLYFIVSLARDKYYITKVFWRSYVTLSYTNSGLDLSSRS